MEIKIYSSNQSRELDGIAIDKFGIPGDVLMRRAGKQAFHHLSKRFKDFSSIVVLCGSGNNGGDGYVAALCALEAGFNVQVLFSEEPKSNDATLMYQRYLEAGGMANRFQGLLPDGKQLVVDAILGTGIRDCPKGRAAKMIQLANRSTFPVVALDVPSGLDSDSGHAHDPCIRALMTVTFIARKVGCYTGDGPDCCGIMVYESLDVPKHAFKSIPTQYSLLPSFKEKPRRHNSHKRDYGDLTVIGGSRGMFGAVLLAGRAAMRAGCGLVTVVSTRRHADKVAIHCPEIMSLGFAQNQKRERLLARTDALIVGPGLDDSVRGCQMFAEIERFDGPVVVDAGALRILSTPLFRRKRHNWILTPHAGEAAALLGSTASEIQRNRIQAAVEIVDFYGGVCVLKGAGTIIAASSGQIKICDRGNPGMATAGMGDVLSGIIGAFLAAGYDVNQAAARGVWFHSTAADLAAQAFSSSSLIASDVIESLPMVFKRNADQRNSIH